MFFQRPFSGPSHGSELVSDLITNVSDNDFEAEVLNSETPVLVDFWAAWCGPCKAIAPLIEDVAKEYEGRLKVVKVDVDSSQKTAVKYSIRSIPTLMVFKDGDVHAQQMGAVPKSQITRLVDNAL